jgi:iodotyrosine deiodinase
MSSVQIVDGYPFAPLVHNPISIDESNDRGRRLLSELKQRRSVRRFSTDPVPRALIEHAILCAASAPSGANRQPWTFVAISDASIKKQIQEAAEEEEKINYAGRMPEAWQDALAPLGTDANKPYLTAAPWLVAVFSHRYGIQNGGDQEKNYYVQESVGIACGLFIAAIHRMGLTTLPHTPSPMGFLSRILGRPSNENPYLLFPVGYPKKGVLVPILKKKNLSEVAIFKEKEI